MRDSNAEERYKQIENQKLESMLGLCELITCRRHSLLAYFDEQAAETCGQCDNCVNPPEQWDATESAQKALSCIYRTGQRFGVNYLINILLGKEDDRIIQYQHNALSTFGIGKALSAHEWRSLFRQLLTLGYIDADVEKHGALILTEKSRPLLSGKQTLMLRKLIETGAVVDKKDKNKAIKPQDSPLWEALKMLRLALAQEYGVPPYVIFHDATLQAMLRQRPTTLADMGKLSGVGQQKLERYGKAFLEEIKSHPLPALLQNNLSATINETLILFQQGSRPSEVAIKRELSLNTVYSHLAAAIEVGLITVMDVINMKETEYNSIVAMIESFESEEKGRLKPVYDAFEGEYEYGVIRCVQASL
jgi:ATP-dependent DNA helicase RecQ